jgi:hypothetical protein
LAANSFLGFFEGDENARLGIHARAINQKFDAEHGFAATRAATDESRPSARESAEGYFIEAGDSGQRLFQAIKRLGWNANDRLWLGGLVHPRLTMGFHRDLRIAICRSSDLPILTGEFMRRKVLRTF